MKSFKNFQTINKCRSCASKKLSNIYNLGHQSFGGIFPLSKIQNVPTGPWEIIKFNKCDLLQIRHNFNRGKMFGINYGYESGINKSMKKHVNVPITNALSVESNEKHNIKYHNINII